MAPARSTLHGPYRSHQRRSDRTQLGRSLDLPHSQPHWQRLQAADVRLDCHAGPSASLTEACALGAQLGSLLPGDVAPLAVLYLDVLSGGITAPLSFVRSRQGVSPELMQTAGQAQDK